MLHMHYVVEKTVEHRLDDAKRTHRNATFVRELRARRSRNRRGVLAALMCRLTSWTRLELSAELSPLGHEAYLSQPRR